jgi:ABC-type dipeptide/oligopeptide/nickel transport system ATPase component
MSSLLSVDSLHVVLRDGPAIVDGISFEIAAGETFALLGESGCGKSMTALSLMRLLPEGVHNVGGAVRLGDASLLELPEREMRRVRGGRMAMIFQEPGLSLNPVMTVGQQIAEVLALHGVGRDSSRRGSGVGLKSDLRGGGGDEPAVASSAAQEALALHGVGRDSSRRGRAGSRSAGWWSAASPSARC